MGSPLHPLTHHVRRRKKRFVAAFPRPSIDYGQFWTAVRKNSQHSQEHSGNRVCVRFPSLAPYHMMIQLVLHGYVTGTRPKFGLFWTVVGRYPTQLDGRFKLLVCPVLSAYRLDSGLCNPSHFFWWKFPSLDNGLGDRCGGQSGAT